MLFFVKTEVTPGKVDELTEKVIRHELKPVSGNLVYLSPDGTCGYDTVEGANEAEIRDKYKAYNGYLKIVELTPIVSAGHFYEEWKHKHGTGGTMGGLRQ